MLKILENALPDQIYKILMELLIKYRYINNYGKILGLIIKCALRVLKKLPEQID